MKETNAFAIYGEEALNQVLDEVRQTYPDTCAIKAQQLVLNSFGIHLTEDQLREEATANGWYTPGGGTPMGYVGKLLELHGVPMHQYVNGNICNVVNELALGHKVIMGVDSGELWHYGLREKIEDHIPGIGGADHALIVSGINTDNPRDVKVIITDPGTGDFRKEYSLAQFVDAANDSNFYMVTTDQAVPHIFDSYGLGIDHLPIIGDMTYSYFRDHFAFLHDVGNRPVFSDLMHHLQSHAWDDVLAMSFHGTDNITDGMIFAHDDIDGIDDLDDDIDDLDLDY